jgi:hypothetical protein
MGTNLQKTWEKEFLNKEDIWEPICRELEKKSFEQKRNGYPFAKNLKKKFHDKCNTQAINSFRQDRLLGEGLPIF